MANQEHLDILKQGVEVWNQWRKEQANIQVDLSEAKLNVAYLVGINLSKANLTGASLYRANLFGAYLSEANLNKAYLGEANLNHANLNRANLKEADLKEADLVRTDLSFTNLSGTNLSGADLSFANLNRAEINGANLNQTEVRSTFFGDVDLRTVQGLDTVIHHGPSTIGIDMIYRSQGQIPQSFLRKAGVPASFLEVMAAITNRPIEYYTVFISYSSRDQVFAERLYADLQSKGVRCWFAPEDLPIGAKIRPSIDESIRLYDKLLLILSQHSVASQWVEQEVETALDKERQKNRKVLFPIHLDKTVMDIEGGWPALIRHTRNIGDFTLWKNHDEYQKAFSRLLRDLKASSSDMG